jgi:sugar diacid utilization regulator
LLTQEIAEEIVKDPTGAIIASGDTSHISFFHEVVFIY